MSKGTNLGLFGLFGEFAQGARTIGRAVSASRNSSISEYLGSTAVEPTCLIEGSLVHLDVTESLTMSLLESYACMYVQVAARLNAVTIDAVKVTRTLEKLATDRDILSAVAATESEGANFISLGLEAGIKVGDKAFTAITENNSLSVGKLVKLEVSNGRESLDIPVSIRFRSRIVPSDVIGDIFKANHADFNMLTRIKLYSREEITLGEALSGSDIIAAQERVRAADKEGLVKSHFTSAMKDAGYAAITGEIPINRASGVTIIDTRTEAAVNRIIRGKISNPRDRAKFFEGTATMVLAVVNIEEEVVDIYYRGFKDGSTETFRSLMRSSKNSSNDLTPVVKDLLSGRVG
ncbi:hypothetical protein TSMG0017 [Halocynthia phage JM-2012]|uniref:hypothetical protein n=1 Tax=Halocynthia phage JM-2012 TaxID=1173297 RepID=UPI00025C68E0|nr:hypothetical protein TSMG0017 [Halocynthia phage JM-2012]AFI55300.1 hypothetical protein TSMG0017 [Halocynthia phage JM-2012]